MIELVEFWYLIRVVAIAAAVSYVITGTNIGFYARVIWWWSTHWIPVLGLESLALCPSCNAWWGGLVTAVLTGSSLWVALQCAFVACLFAAILQVKYGLAAADEDKIRGIFKREQNGESD